MILLAISFIAGVLSVLAPCVLPLLPVIVGGSLVQGGERRRSRAVVIALSLGVSIILFTLLLKVSTVFINVPPDIWKYVSGVILVAFGVVMIFPQLWDRLGFVNLLNRQSNKALALGYQRNSFVGDLLMGAALGPVFASCSPTYFVILATVLPVSLTMGIIDLIAYAVGLSGALLLIALAGQSLVDKLGITIEPGGWFRRSIGVLFVAVGVLVFTGAMARIEAKLLEQGFDVTVLEQKLLRANEMPEVEIPTKSDQLASSTEGKAPMTTIIKKSSIYKRAPELVAPNGYINTAGQPVTLAQYKGKNVVLIDIWTYSCINCQRTLPYLKSWYEKYKDQGLEIIGVHTPEFAFEKVQKNVENAVAEFGLAYPVILDNEYKTWNAFGNQYWPRKYLIDIDGYIVYDHAGEGSYDEAEAAIQKALHERAERLGIQMDAMHQEGEPQDMIDVDFSSIRSPETYFGAWRNELFGNGTPFQEGQQTLVIPEGIRLNTFYLSGTWDFTREYMTNLSEGARLKYIYSSKDVYFVATADSPVKIRVTRDGLPLGSARGADVDEAGFVTIEENRLYRLVEDSVYGQHTLEIEVDGAGLKAYTFTFG